MRIGINLNGVSYNDGKNGGRYRNYEDAVDNFYKYIVDPLKAEGYEVLIYIYTYDSEKKDEIIKRYNPVKYEFLPEGNHLGGGDLFNHSKTKSAKAITYVAVNGLLSLHGQNLDLIISTRFDINFFKNPFKEYKFDFNKCNFLWREPEYTDIPLVNDTFIVFPYSMLFGVMEGIYDSEDITPNIGLHNIYNPIAKYIGYENIQWVCDDFVNTLTNDLYKLTRHE